MASSSALIEFSSDEGRESRQRSVEYLVARAGAGGSSRTGLVRFVSAIDEARHTWGADDDERETWLQCTACKKWRRGLNGLDLTRWSTSGGTPFTCQQNIWRPAQARCSVKEEEIDEEDWEEVENEGEEGEEQEQEEEEEAEEEELSAGAAASTAYSGGGRGAGSSSSSSSSSSSAVAADMTEYYLGDTEPETEEE